MRMLLLALLLPTAPQATPADTLTSESLHAWLNAAHVPAEHARLVHVQMQQQRAKLPPWWPDDVYAQEEEAVEKVDFIEPALPYYAACFTDSEARLATKLILTKTGQQLAHTATQANLQSAEQGAPALDARIATIEDAVHNNAAAVSDEKRKIAESLTPAELALAEREFTPAHTVAIRQCAREAYVKTHEVIKARQEEALRMVVAANRPKLQAARAQWENDHPDSAQK